MLTISGESASELVTRTCRAVVDQGRPVAPRGLPTTEVLGAELVLRQPSHRFTDVAPVRVLNPAFAAAEALWILSDSDDEWIFAFNERLRRFADHGRLQGAYGPRQRRWHGQVDQLDAVRRALQADDATRQAVLTLFDPARDFSGYRDVPCTLGYRFSIRDGVLHTFTTMRSQDAWLDLPYDVFTFTILHELLAGWLDVGPGAYHHLVDFLHLYDQHTSLATALPTPSPAPGMGRLRVPWEDFDALLAQVITGEAVGSNGWDDFAAVLASYRLWKRRNYDSARALLRDEHRPLGMALQRWYTLLDTEPGAIAAAPAAPARRSEVGV